MTRQATGRMLMTIILTVAANLALAQPPPRPAPPPPPPPPPPIGATLEFVGAEMPLSAVLRGAPFSADGITTVSQTLGDGTRIDRRLTAKIYRDTEGRVRREQTVLGLDVLNPAGDAQPLVTITDPVAALSYVLDPNTRTARRNGLAFERGDVFEKLRVAGRGVVRPRAGEPPPPVPPPPPPPGERPARRPANVPNWPEPLGTRQIEGVTVVGTRRTETIPAGRIGNDRPIVVTDERWESPDLKMVILSQHHDPRTGDVEYRLTNISRAEPAHHLFTVPADYTVVDTPPPPPPPPAQERRQ